jgi:hypothetical protein
MWRREWLTRAVAAVTGVLREGPRAVPSAGLAGGSGPAATAGDEAAVTRQPRHSRREEEHARNQTTLVGLPQRFGPVVSLPGPLHQGDDRARLNIRSKSVGSDAGVDPRWEYCQEQASEGRRRGRRSRHDRTDHRARATGMSPLLLVLAVWALLSVLVVAGLCLLLHGRSVFNPGPRHPATARDTAVAPGPHAVV